MRIRVPPKRTRERFLIIYELSGCQKAVDFLTDYYHVRKLRIVLDGRRVPRKCCGAYFRNTAWFTREGLKRRVILHELFHHLVDKRGFELTTTEEEKRANGFAREFLKRGNSTIENKTENAAPKKISRRSRRLPKKWRNQGCSKNVLG